MPLRSGKTRNFDLPPKRQYKKKDEPSTAAVLKSPIEIQQVSTPNQSMNISMNVALQLSQSTIKDSNDNEWSVTLDSYDRIVKKSERKKRKKCVAKRKYEPLEDHESIFVSLASVDKYVRISNQYGMKTMNNNQVKCTMKNCDQTKRHEMTQMYLKCLCKQITCSLWYSLI
jgi:hypothetical protein